MRIVVLAGLAFLLSACSNMVYSDTPLFAAEDTRNAPAFRPGVWIAAAPGCDVRIEQPIQTWPPCAVGLVFDRHGLKPPPGALRQLVAAGDPVVVQQPYDGMVLYNGLGVLDRDDKGRAIAYETWSVLCGPPPPRREGEADVGAPPRRDDDAEAKEGAEAANEGLALELLPGLEAAGNMCRASDPRAVRNAAARSRAWAGSLPAFSWARRATGRDRYDGDLVTTGFRKLDESGPAPAP